MDEGIIGMKRMLYYIQLGYLDLVRLWSSTQQQVIIVTGICLPILLLLGLKRGHVAELEKDLVTSPTGRQVILWAAQKGDLLSPDLVKKLEKQLPEVDIIVPDTQRVVNLASNGSEKANLVAEGVTIYSTKPGDPLLAQLGIVWPETPGTALVLGGKLASFLGVKEGDSLELQVSRERGGTSDQAKTAVKVLKVVPLGDNDSRIAYADVGLIDKLEQYVRGYRVPEWNWPALKAAARDGYQGYILITEVGADLKPGDFSLLKDRGFVWDEEDTTTAQIFWPLLKPDSKDKLKFRFIHGLKKADGSYPDLYLSPSEISQNTEADDVAIAWNLPMDQIHDKGQMKVIGLTLPKRNWIRSYFQDPLLAFHYEDIGMVYRSRQDMLAPLQLHLGQKQGETKLKLAPSAPERTGPAPKPLTESLVLLPANVFSWVRSHSAGKVDFDESLQLFVPKPEEPMYDKARLYGTSIYSVPKTVEVLQSMGYAVQSETSRIMEIKSQDGSLQLLVIIVASGVFLFGVVTVVSVLKDSTDRKRATIGIMRVMGVSRAGIFLMIFARAATIGVMAALLSVGFGFTMAWALGLSPETHSYLAWKPQVSIHLNPFDFGLIVLGAIFCCLIGAIMPAWVASRLDPFDAIIEGRFR